MKKFIIPIFMLLPLMTAEAQTVLTEEQQLEQAQKQLEAAKKALEVAKIKAQAAKLKAQADSINAASAKEPTTSTSGWAIPVAVAAKPKEAAKPANKLANGTTAKVDMKYLAGAITYNDENKIEFTLDTDANGKTAKQIYDIVLKYMSELTQNEQNIASRVALVNDTEHVIANTMDEWLVFSQSFISLDRTEFKYQLIARISDNHLNLSLCRIIYNYEEGRSTGFKEPAEEVISDKIALNKKQNDLAKIFGKFRRCTIDRKDQIFAELAALVKQ
ncbi:DUF4468 domain-containing protein [Segatella copri]|uniref:DUF4468 domain-containing protein n=1 Tax=Segatella copri TaxID=165179 RepID=A0A6I2TRR5_9BACT|nr:DUF4468 domain-containing protein [Segatella copri]MST76256.1 DUF4468 domain-containing protein [Segatella copri]